jgi:UDP-2,3-diacylglucosamine pyrophosphatase LpxH
MVLLPGSDIYIASDLHLGEGWLDKQQRYSRLETFFYDNEFQNFVQAILYEQSKRERLCTLVLNGDIFDFLSVVRVPEPVEARKWGLRISKSEKKFGLDSTEQKAEWKMARILHGHRGFVVALVELLAAGNAVVIVRGNHDLELHWDAVQRRFLNQITKLAEEEGYASKGEELLERVAFRQWFYYEPGRFFIEHGNQYEASNAIRFQLNPILPAEQHAHRKESLDYPMGSMFVRYLYNKLKLLDPFSTQFVTLEQYVRLTYNHNLLDLARTGVSHLPFFMRAIKDARIFELHGMAPVKEKHESAMDALGEESGLSDKLRVIESWMSHPAGATKYALLKELLKPALRGFLVFIVVVLVCVEAWFLIFAAIQHTAALAGGVIAKATLTGVLVLSTIIALFLIYSFLKRALHQRGDPSVLHCYERAEQIAELLDVPCVSMGHTHTADHRHLKNRRGTYTNTGTWIPRPGPWDAVKPKARQFTFARIQGTSMDLLRWADAKRIWEPVTLLEEYRASTFEKLLTDTGDPDRSAGADDV